MNGKKFAHHATPPVAILISILMLAGTICPLNRKKRCSTAFATAARTVLRHMVA